ncbi:immune inhibitor A domain-containing protein [Actinoplanes sp. DH11]|uniref:immune inhibitor A domain-containing protein n=1 Tax=Actinoplanes sp. DH11 TaxID=2857011 RepID=UPI001E62A87B|nr:immune inhibitor A domain-containing protein [Actinoplanes sp. DH11]
MSAAPPSPGPSAPEATPAASGTAVAEDTRELTPTRLTLNGKPLPPATYRPGPTGRRAAADSPPVGTVRTWAGLNEIESDVYPKDYELRAVGEYIEVWVAKDLAFPAGDCRGEATTVTDAQVADLVREFDEKIYPRETAAFSTPPERTGVNAGTNGDFTGAGHRTVTLVDNVRDDNYFNFPERPTYISGFFSAQLNELFDRNVLTIDAFDWAHRMGANPRNEPTDDLCTSRPARPWMYESTFAHEWQHLLTYYTDPEEESWLEEGLSDYAQSLTGYVASRRGVHHLGFDNHLTCYQGFGGVKTLYNPNPRDCNGPANSLNLWDEGNTADGVLADYGITYQLMLYLHDRFGMKILSALHHDTENRGLDALAAALPAGTNLYDVLHDFQTMTLVDKSTDEPDSVLKGVDRDRVSAASLRSTVNLSSPASHGTPGAPPNGADYVRLPNRLRSVTFQGAATLPPSPLAWKLDAGALFSGNDADADAAAVRPVEVPARDAVLRFTTTYRLEPGFDHGYVTVSADGGRTYRTVAGDETVTGPLGPALTGIATDVRRSYDLSAYAGKRVLLGFRYVSDSAVNRGGWHVGDISVGAVTIDSASLDGWRSFTQVRPLAVHNWHVTLVGLGRARAKVVALEDFAKLRDYPKVAAIVAYDEPTGTVRQYAPYTLTVNGQTFPAEETAQPGGSTP